MPTQQYGNSTTLYTDYRHYIQVQRYYYSFRNLVHTCLLPNLLIYYFESSIRCASSVFVLYINFPSVPNITTQTYQNSTYYNQDRRYIYNGMHSYLLQKMSTLGYYGWQMSWKPKNRQFLMSALIMLCAIHCRYNFNVLTQVSRVHLQCSSFLLKSAQLSLLQS